MTRFLRVSALVAALMLMTAPSAAAGDPVRPFGGTTTSSDGYGPPTCPGAAWQYFSSGPGNITHLGVVTIEVTHCTWLDSLTTGHFGPGTATFTAANGDTLILSQWGTFESVMTPDSFLSFVDLEWVVIDGSGRFEGATGAGEGAVVGDIWAGTSTATYWGTIVYDASDRSGE